MSKRTYQGASKSISDVEVLPSPKKTRTIEELENEVRMLVSTIKFTGASAGTLEYVSKRCQQITFDRLKACDVDDAAKARTQRSMAALLRECGQDPADV